MKEFKKIYRQSWQMATKWNWDIDRIANFALCRALTVCYLGD